MVLDCDSDLEGNDFSLGRSANEIKNVQKDVCIFVYKIWGLNG